MLDDFSKDELNQHIILILTKKRERMRRVSTKAIVGKEEADNPGTQWFGGDLAPRISHAFKHVFLPMYGKSTNTRYRFDVLYGFTAVIYRYWWWMRRHPYGWDGHNMLKVLAAEWRDMLAKTPEELGVDPVFSFPAIKAFVAKFKVDLEEEECICPSGLLFEYE